MARPGSGSSSGSGATKKPAREVLNGGTIKDIMVDMIMFFMMNSAMGAVRRGPAEGMVRETIGKLVGDHSKPIESDGLDKVLATAKKFVTDSMPESDRRKMDDVFTQLWEGVHDVRSNSTLSAAEKQTEITRLKNAANERLREIKESRQAHFQTRVFEMLDDTSRGIAMTWIGKLDTAQCERWAVVQDRIESPQAFAACMNSGGTVEDKLKMLENLTAKPKVAATKSILDQIGELINSPTLAKLFGSHKSLPARATVVDLAAPPPDYRRSETDDEYHARLIASGDIKPEDDFATRLREEKKHAAKAKTLERIDAEDDAIMRLARGEFKDK